MIKKFTAIRADWRVVLFAVAAIVLTGSALAGPDAGEKADQKKMSETCTLDKQKYLDAARHRLECLDAEMKRDAEAALKGATNSMFKTNSSFMQIRFTHFLETFKEKVPKYSSRYRAQRTEIMNKELPSELSGAKNDLLSSIDTSLSKLEKLQKMDLEGLVLGLLHDMEKSMLKDADAGKGDVHVRDWSPLALSLVPACEIPCKEWNVYGIRLNLVGGSHHDVAGMDVGGVFNHVSKDLYGIQFGGLSNIAKYRVEGIQLTGFFNLGGCRFTGMQGSGGVNAAGDVQGVQFAVMGNLDMRIRGFQIAGGGNLTIMGKGCQFAGIGMNLADQLTGMQCSGFWNVGHVLDGMQLALVNSSDNCRGVQIGAVNMGRKMAGLQVGVLNCTHRFSGCQIGLCNVITDSSVPFLPVVNMSF